MLLTGPERREFRRKKLSPHVIDLLSVTYQLLVYSILQMAGWSLQDFGLETIYT